MLPVNQMMFDYQGAQLRTVTRDGEPWFVAKDVCEILEISNPTVALQRLDEEERSKFNLGRQGDTNIVSESGLYELIFGSRKKEAQEFKKWVKREVLPSIRKTGKYSTESTNVVPLSKDKALVTVLRTTADLVEGQEEIRKEQFEIKKWIGEVDKKVEEQITLNSGEQRKLQKEIAKRVYELSGKEEVQQLGFQDGLILPDLRKVKDILFKLIHKTIKDSFAVPSYKDIRRCDFSEVLKLVAGWRPKIVA